LLALSLSASNSPAQEPSKEPATGGLVAAGTTDTVDTASINAAITQLQSKSDLDETTKNNALQLYQSALKRLEAREQSAKKSTEYDQAIQTAPQTLLDIKQELQQLANSRPTIPFGLPSNQLEQRRVQLQAEGETQRKLFDQLTE
jgi:seryl-tRNA synthetase